PVGCGAPGTTTVSVVIGNFPVLLILAFPSSKPGRCLGQVITPALELFRGECRYLVVTELGFDEGAVAVLNILDGRLRAPVVLEELDIRLDSLRHGDRPAPAIRFPGTSVGASDHALSGFLESLSIIQKCNTVRIGKIVRYGDNLDLVGPVLIVARDPFAGALKRFAIAKMQARLDRAVVRIFRIKIGTGVDSVLRREFVVSDPSHSTHLNTFLQCKAKVPLRRVRPVFRCCSCRSSTAPGKTATPS